MTKIQAPAKTQENVDSDQGAIVAELASGDASIPKRRTLSSSAIYKLETGKGRKEKPRLHALASLLCHA